MLIHSHITMLAFGVPLWGSLVFFAVIFALFYSYKESIRLKCDFYIWRNFILFLIGFGFFGMRLLRTLREASSFDPKEIIYSLVMGGIDSLGILLGVAAGISYLFLQKKQKKIDSIGIYLDSLAISGAILIIFARIGCFFNLCEAGFPSDLPWAIMQNGASVHPIALYYIINGVIVYSLLLVVVRFEKEYISGNLFSDFLILYLLGRGLIDFMRISPQHIFFGLNIHQIFTFITLILVLIYRIHGKFSMSRYKIEN